MSWNLVHMKDIPCPHLLLNFSLKYENLQSHVLAQNFYVAKKCKLGLWGLKGPWDLSIQPAFSLIILQLWYDI